MYASKLLIIVILTAVLSCVVIMNKLLPCNGQNSQLFLAEIVLY